MVKEVTMYTVVCDNCGTDVCEGAEYSCWGDSDYAKDVAIEADWANEGDLFYCPKCFSYDDEDNIVINPITK